MIQCLGLIIQRLSVANTRLIINKIYLRENLHSNKTCLIFDNTKAKQMRKATPISYSANNKVNQVAIDNYGTTSWVGFLSILYKGGVITYEQYIKDRSIVYTQERATRLLNQNIDLFPVQF